MAYDNQKYKDYKVPIYLISFVIAVCGNVMVLVVRIFYRRTASAYNFLISQLALADLVFSTAIPLEVYSLNNKDEWDMGVAMCKIVKVTHSSSMSASVGIMTILALERFQGISQILHNHWRIRKAFFYVVVIWCYCYLSFVPYFFALDVDPTYKACLDHCYPSDAYRKSYAIFQFVTTFVLPLGAMGYLHCRILKSIRYHTAVMYSKCQNISVFFPGQNSTQTRKTIRKRDRKIAHMLISILVIFGMMTLPIQIFYIWYEFSDRAQKSSANLYVVEIFASLVFLHSGVNPIIYSVMDKNFREDVVNIFRKQRRAKYKATFTNQRLN